MGGISCDEEGATFNCSAPQLYDMQADKEENHDLALAQPEVLAAILTNFSIWQQSVLSSMANESKCGDRPHGGGGHHAQFPKNRNASSACTYAAGMRQEGSDIAFGTVASKEECCGACEATEGCHAGDFAAASTRHPTWDGKTAGGTCHLKSSSNPKPGTPAQTAVIMPE
eukprot:SAG11_NODE_494_length_8948_cov_2.882699_4_plen_170_part_00